MKQENIVVGLDVGTTKICAVVAEKNSNRVMIQSISSVPSTGLRKGVVINKELTADSIKKAVKSAESLTGIEIRAVHIGISGGHIKGFDSYGAVSVRDKKVMAIDVERAIDSAKEVYMPLNREVLQVIPMGYSVDGRNGIVNPIGMIGNRLEVKVYIITGAIRSVQNLLQSCQDAGVDVIDIVFEPLAAAEAILTDEEKKKGVAVIDIGGGTTDIVLYKNGWIRHSAVFDIGGNHFTNDIAVCLNLSIQEAERIKKTFGMVAKVTDGSEEIEIFQESQQRKIMCKDLSEIIMSRAEELLNLIKAELILCSGYEIASQGVVLTGGGSLLEGLIELAESKLCMPVRIGVARGLRGCSDIISNPMYSTGAGLVLHGVSTEIKEYYPDVSTGILNKMKSWAQEIFR
ncbi:MAG: cell division protein FtsA [Nitrospirae bacterium]|nr:cell division protein FtsA [Nitrospirota bacterium]